jgi:small subunit ribosomal protein S5
VPAEDLWKGVTSVSNAGKKRGRAKGLVRRKDLNRGQVIGIGKANIQWPGLSAPIIRGRELVQRNQLPPDPDREQKLIKLRDQMGSSRYQKLSPLERGWSGSKVPGRSIGPPDPIGEDAFENFDTKVIEFKQVFNMKGNLGRKRRLSAFVVTGNKNGLAGFATAKATDGKAVLRKAKNRAAQKLMYIELCDGHTVFHDFGCRFGLTKIFVQKKPDGYGVVAHRAIREICQLVGIKNLHAKVEGAKNVQHIVKAFFLGLLKQKRYEEIAESKGLHVVEYRPEFGNFPKIVASPKVCRKEEDIRYDEVMDYNQFAMDGKVMLKKKKFPPSYVNSYGFHIHLKKKEGIRNHWKIRFNMMRDYGEVKSYLTDKYPDARPLHEYLQLYKKDKQEENMEEEKES